MAEINSNTNILPNNPMKAHDLLDHLKQVKGNMGWYEFNLRTLIAAYPDDKVFKQALEAELGAKTEKATTATDKADKAPEQAPAPKPTAKAKSKGKTLAEVTKANTAKKAAEEPGDSLPPTTEELEELASIGQQ